MPAIARRRACDPAEGTIGGHIAVDLAGLARAEDDFQQALHGLEAELRQLDGELQASLAEWAGAAQQAYQQAYQQAHSQWQAAAGV